jgi:DNA-binding transcriptional LysR family regulator
MQDGIAEIAFVRTPDRLPSDLAAAISIPEHLVILGEKGNKWIDPDKDSVDIKDLHAAPLSIPRGFAPLITDECLRRGFRPTLLSVSTTRYMTLYWARLGESLAIIPSDDPKKFETDKIICRDLNAGRFRSSRSLIYNNEKELSAVARQFIDYCSENID